MQWKTKKFSGLALFQCLLFCCGLVRYACCSVPLRYRNSLGVQEQFFTLYKISGFALMVLNPEMKANGSFAGPSCLSR